MRQDFAAPPFSRYRRHPDQANPSRRLVGSHRPDRQNLFIAPTPQERLARRADAAGHLWGRCHSPQEVVSIALCAIAGLSCVAPGRAARAGCLDTGTTDINDQNALGMGHESCSCPTSRPIGNGGWSRAFDR